jgi:hypothetical protein
VILIDLVLPDEVPHELNLLRGDRSGVPVPESVAVGVALRSDPSSFPVVDELVYHVEQGLGGGLLVGGRGRALHKGGPAARLSVLT